MLEINTLFFDVVNEYDLEQCVHESTRHDHLLDLVFASQPSLIESITTTPGMSDHEAVIFSINTHSVLINKKNMQKCFTIKQINEQFEIFPRNLLIIRSLLTVHQSKLETILRKLLLKIIPQRVIKSHKCLPWISTWL